MKRTLAQPAASRDRRSAIFRTALVLGGLVHALAAVRPAFGFEFFDGRLQVHGFYEMQLRALNAGYGEDWDLAQWYNVLDVEMELDIAPDGIGPIGLLQGFVRLEARYDCIYTGGCGVFPSANAYGDDAQSLPRRLSDAVERTAVGQIRIPSETSSINGELIDDVVDGERRSGATTDPVPTSQVTGFSILARQPGADGFLDGQSPGICVSSVGFAPQDPEILGLCEQTATPEILSENPQLSRLRPGQRLPLFVVDGEIEEVPDPGDPGNPTRRLVGTVLSGDRALEPEEREELRAALIDDFDLDEIELDEEGITGSLPDDPFAYVFENFDDFRFTQINALGGARDGSPVRVFGPWLPKNFVELNGTLADRVNPFDNTDASRVLQGAAFNNELVRNVNVSPVGASGGSFSRVDTPGVSDDILSRAQDEARRVRGGGALPFRPIPTVRADGSGPQLLLRDADGDGSPDFDASGQPIGQILGRGVFESDLPGSTVPAADAKPVFGSVPRPGLLQAQGLYYPSRALREVLGSGRLDSFTFNFTEAERAWNRGASQQDEKELKEAYLDIEALDYRLWLRVGKQSIVWGKTELFRTTDQFNPQDLALASLPSLEESRIALWGARGVYSLYEVGPLSDVRVELALNYDQFEPNDLGACGEAYAPNPVCQLTFGAFAHGTAAVGIAGVDRPRRPWEGLEGWEIGGRVEFRWSRFSIALIDFYGYNDLPYLERISTYERNVDPRTGLPRLMGALAPCLMGTEASCLTRGPTDIRPALVPNNLLGNPTRPRNQVANEAFCVEGTFDSDLGRCVLPDGSTGLRNFDPTGEQDDVVSGFADRNALFNHHANQQIFGLICSTTIGFNDIDLTACAQTIFNSLVLQGGVPVTQLLSGTLAGDNESSGAGRTLAVNLASTQALPLVQLSRDPGDDRNDALFEPDPNAPGALVEVALDCLDERSGVPCGGPGTAPWSGESNGSRGLSDRLTPEQEALIGCGPFWGTNCDDSGIDLLNAEASVLLQAMSGFDGIDLVNANRVPEDELPCDPGMNPDAGGRPDCAPTQFQTNNGFLRQPGTVGFLGGPVCTIGLLARAGGDLRGDDILPGCRPRFVLDPDSSLAVRNLGGVRYGPNGHLLPVRGQDLAAGNAWNILRDGNPNGPLTERELDAIEQQRETLFGFRRLTPEQIDADGDGIDDDVISTGTRSTLDLTDSALGQMLGFDGRLPFAPAPESGTGALPSGVHPFTGQPWSNELAAVSWNFMMTLVPFSDEWDAQIEAEQERALEEGEGAIGAEEAVARFAYVAGTDQNPVCSFVTPQYCSNLYSIFVITGNLRNVVRAGGNTRYGRRAFEWHSGGEAVLRYEKRNVLGASIDFAEDATKSNWSVEFTWIEGVPQVDHDSFDGISRSDELNLTISLDRPTFINFLNSNRTFFINSQWFIQYRPGYEDGFAANGPWNVLGTFTVNSGYFQDRLMPQLTAVFDVNSRSGALLPQVSYRFNDSFSTTVGALWFFGRYETVDMPLNELSPATNRIGPNAYRDWVENGLSVVRDRDEVFLRIRYTF